MWAAPPVESLVEPGADIKADGGDQDADRERDAPAPGGVARLGKREREHDANDSARDAAQVLARELPARKEHAAARGRGLQHEHRRRPDLPSHGEALHKAGDDQENWG